MLKTKNISVFAKDFDIIHYGELPPPDNATCTFLFIKNQIWK